MKRLMLTTLALGFVGSMAMAGECAMKISREPCPGKETEALKPYDGKKETEEKKDAADQAACSALATKSAKIVRKGTLASKTVTATFAGTAVTGNFTDSKACK